MVDDKNFFVATRRTLENAIPEKKYFKAWRYTTQTKHPWEMIFFVYHKFGWDKE